METNTFTINNDKAADWAITKIKEREEERDRLIELAKSQIEDLKLKIEDLNKSCDNDNAYLKSMLSDYFFKVKHHVTATQESYQLLNGKLIFKKPSEKIEYDNDKLIQHLEGSEYIKVTKAVNWAEYKKHLQIVDNKVINDETGEVVDACIITPVVGEFIVK